MSISLAEAPAARGAPPPVPSRFVRDGAPARPDPAALPFDFAQATEPVPGVVPGPVHGAAIEAASGVIPGGMGMPTAADMAACRALLCGGSKSFHAASLLLPWRVRDAATALYAFCRLADDAVDCEGGSGLGPLRERLDRAYCGRPMPIPADRAFAAVAARYAIPRTLPEALLEGFAWDAEGRRYETIGELHAYSTRVAGTVGAMMALLMGVREPNAVARAADLGLAMQLSNIARDVGEDARNGRLYLPRAWLREAGIDPEEFLARPAFTPALGGVVRRLLAEADRLYRRAEAGIARLPPDCRPGIAAARLIYAEIGREVERRGGDSVSGRAVVSTRRKLALLARSMAAAARPAQVSVLTEPPVPESAFLIDAVTAVPGGAGRSHAMAPGRDLRPRSVEGRVVWVLDLFARLEREERHGRALRPAYPRPSDALQA
jgi:phytoene synthase